MTELISMDQSHKCLTPKDSVGLERDGKTSLHSERTMNILGKKSHVVLSLGSWALLFFCKNK